MFPIVYPVVSFITVFTSPIISVKSKIYWIFAVFFVFIGDVFNLRGIPKKSEIYNKHK